MTESAFALEWEGLGNEGSGPALVVATARARGGWRVRAGASAGSMALAFVPGGEGRAGGDDVGTLDRAPRQAEDGDGGQV